MQATTGWCTVVKTFLQMIGIISVCVCVCVCVKKASPGQNFRPIFPELLHV